jgi:hypothetical protein
MLQNNTNDVFYSIMLALNLKKSVFFIYLVTTSSYGRSRIIYVSWCYYILATSIFACVCLFIVYDFISI